MRVLHVLPALAPEYGGPTAAALQLVAAQRALGVDALIATTDARPGGLLPVQTGSQTDYQGVPVWFFNSSKLRSNEFIFSLPLTRWLWRECRSFDIIHTHYLFTYSTLCACKIARMQGKPYVMRIMGQLTEWSLNQRKLKKQCYAALFERANLTNAAALHCTSELEAADVARFGIANNCIILPHGVTPAPRIPEARAALRERHNLAPGCKIVLFLSRLHRKKRIELLLHAFSELVTEDPDVHLLIAGSGEPEYERELHKAVQDLNLITKVSFTGFVEGAEKDLLLQGADLFALPSFSENFGVAVAEALASGLPVIISRNIQLAAELEAAGAAAICADDVHQLSRELKKLLNDPSRLAALAHNGKMYASGHLNWNRIAAAFIDYYTGILSHDN